MHVARNEIDHGGPSSLVWETHQINGSHFLEKLSGKMRTCAVARIGIVELAGLRFRQCD